MHIGDGFQQNILEKAYFITKMSGLAMVRPAQALTFGKRPEKDVPGAFCKSENFLHFAN